MSLDKNKTITIAVCVLCAILTLCSFFYVAPIMGDVSHYEALNHELDEKRESVVEISSILMGLSIIVAAVPGDATTPLSTQITELSSYLILALSAIMFEKFVLPLLGLAVFKGIAPAALIVLALYTIFKKRKLLEISLNLFVLSVVLIVTIPLGVKAGSVIDDYFGTKDLIAELQGELSDIDALYDEDVAATEDIAAADDPAPDNSTSNNPLSFLQGLMDTAGDTIASAGSSIKKAVTKNSEVIMKKAQAIIGKLMDVIAVMIITDIVLPILMLLIMAGVLKITFTNILHLTPLS